MMNLTEDDLSFNYEPVENAIVRHTGTNLKIMGDFGEVIFNDRVYSASELVFYRQSEHTFGSNQTHLDMEMQVVHRTENNQILVLVLFYRLNTTNSMFLDQLDLTQIQGIGSGDYRSLHSVVDLNLILNGVNRMVSYEGSLSRPPCTPNVDYLVITNIKRIQEAILDLFPEDILDNHREVQEREDRALTLIRYRGGASTTRTDPPPIRSDSPRTNFNPIYDFDEVQGFRLNPDTDIEINRHSSYPIVAEINIRLPFPDYIPIPDETESEEGGTEETEESGAEETEGGDASTESGETADAQEATDETDETQTSEEGSPETAEEGSTEVDEEESTETTPEGSTETTEEGSNETTEEGPAETAEEEPSESTEEESTETTESSEQSSDNSEEEDNTIPITVTDTQEDPSPADEEDEEEDDSGSRVQQTSIQPDPVAERNAIYRARLDNLEHQPAETDSSRTQQWMADNSQQSIINQ